MKWLAILFTLFILLIIVMADAGILVPPQHETVGLLAYIEGALAIFALQFNLVAVLAHYAGFIYEFPLGDKAGHFILYGILTMLIDLALLRVRPEQSRWQMVVISGLVLALLIGLEEVSQQNFSSRSFYLVDLTFSYLGVVFFSWVALKM